MRKQTETDLKMVKKFFTIFADKPRYKKASDINFKIKEEAMSAKEYKKLNKKLKKDVKVVHEFNKLFSFCKNEERFKNVSDLVSKIKDNGMNFKKYMALSEKKKEKLFKASQTMRDINLSINIQGGN